MNKITKIILTILSVFSIILTGGSKVFADINDSNVVKSRYDDAYAVYDGPDRVHLFYAQRYLLNGVNAYCIEPGVAVDSTLYSSTSNLSISGLNSDTLRYVRMVAYYGYDYPNHQTRNYYLAAQEMMWEKISGRSVRWVSQLDVNGPEINVDNEKNEIQSLINNHTKTPSFNSSNIQVNVGETVTLTDTNNVLSNYDIYTTNNAIANISGNTITIKATDERTSGSVTLIRKNYTSQVQLIYYSGSNQKMINSGALDPVLSVVNVKSVGGSVSIEKLDSRTGTIFMGDATLKGATYGIYNENNQLVDTLISGEKEKSKDIPYGKYYVKELIASEGYELDSKTYELELNSNNEDSELKVYEDITKRDVTFFKVYASDKTGFLVGEKNVQFDIYLKSTNEKYTSFTTNEKGYAEVEMVYGTYIVKQVTSTKDYYKIDDFEITINKDSDDPYYQLMSNSEIKAKLKVIKIDSETGEIIKRSNIKFKIFDILNNKYVSQTITYPTPKTIDVFETDSSGVLITPYPLNSGRYLLEEVDQKIDGYLWNEQSEEFTIGENSELITDNEYGILFEVKFKNTAVKGKVDIIKLGEELEISNNSYTYKKINLEGVKIAIYANEHIYDHVGNLIYRKGKLVKELITNIDGEATLDDMYLGKYYLKEISTVDTHILDDKKYEFELNYIDQYTPIVSYSITLENYLPKGELVFSKVDISDSSPLPDTTIKIFTEDDIEIFTGVTNELGQIIIKDLPIGKFYILETDAPEGYNLNDEKMYFEIKENGEIVKATMTDDKIVVEVPNTLQNDNLVLEISLGIITLIGIGMIIYANKNINKKK